VKAAGTTIGAVLVGALAVVCCATPAIIAGISVTALAAWLSYSGYVLIAAVLIAGAVGCVLWLRRRGINAQACCGPAKKASNHE
jgi:type IV secretory pathway VirB3-like protein